MICNKIKKTKLKCKESLKKRFKKYEIEDISKWEYYGCFRKLKIKLNYPIRKDIGYVKSLPSGIPGTNCGCLCIIMFF